MNCSRSFRFLSGTLLLAMKGLRKTACLLFLLLPIGMQVVAQPVKPCPCSSLFRESVQKVSDIYAGFEDKVTDSTRASYYQLVNALQTQADDANDERACYEVIKQYVDWFRDSHVGIWYGVQASPSTIKKLNSAVVERSLRTVKDSLEGKWSTADGKQQFAIIKDPSGRNKYIAVVLKTSDSAWIPGMVKAEFYNYEPKPGFYRAMFYQNNFAGVLEGFTLKQRRFDHWFGPSWFREPVNSSNENPSPSSTVELKKLNKDFIYLRLSKFNEQDVNQLDSLIRVNRSLISTTRNLILDLRDNPGGNSSSSQEMIRLIYTNPIIYPAWQYRSSPEFIKAKQAEVDALLKHDPYNRLKAQQLLLQRLIDHPGKLVSGGDSISRTVDSTSRFPQRVALLVNNGSGSSAEFFAFESKQSKKVTLFGANTYGVMDYGEANEFNLSCGQYVLSIPWGRNGWIERFGFRIDNVGFKPDVRTPATETDWVQFIVNYWSR